MRNININEYIVLKNSNKTARIIEIYGAQDVKDKLFYVYFPDGTNGYVFESQSQLLSQFDLSQRS